MATVPLVSVILAVHNGERYLRTAIESVLRQTISDLELVVVDDGSIDTTPAILDGVDDPRLKVLRNEERLGLAASLNRALEETRGRYVARLDADDVAMPDRLERQLARITSGPPVAVLGTAAIEVDGAGRLGRLLHLPERPAAVRWAALFSSPFFHPSVLVDREVLDRHGLRYDSEYLESEDYDLWTRVLAVADGGNLRNSLLLYRVHASQASRRRRELQRGFQQRIALREIAQIAPELRPRSVELAWRVGVGDAIDPDELEVAAAAHVELLHAFDRRVDGSDARHAAARAVARVALRGGKPAQIRILRMAAELDPALPGRAASGRLQRRVLTRAARREAEEWLSRLEAASGPTPIRVAAIFPEPTPYRAPLLDRVAELPEVDLTVLYAAETVADRTWRVRLAHRAVFLRGMPLPGARRILHHDYPVTPGVARALGEARPDAVVVSGWSTFAAQAAIAWCRLKRVPYLLVVESHDEGPRAGWRRKVKGAAVPPIVRHASGALVTGTLARRSMVARGARPERVRVFANTIDVEGFGELADRLASRRPGLREQLEAGPDDVVVLSVARLQPEKGLDVLVRAVAAAGDPRLLLVVAGEGPERAALERLAWELGVRLVLTGDWASERIVEVYVAADAFALLSEREPWAVVVNEAAACGLPLVLSDRVGAAHDLLRDGMNGTLVPAGDVTAAARALRELAADASLREAQGARSRELAQEWGYGPSVDAFLAAVREAVANHR